MAQISIEVQNSNNIVATVVPTPNNVIQLSRGVVGPAGPAGPNEIGGYPITITSPQNSDLLMWQTGTWVNTNQTEVTDGGNF